ncbi:MAG: hypothetical protein U9N87_06265 [Planctomycetota bacterium]|nr:hypothetical protein [Planctomycetota bacterium]
MTFKDVLILLPCQSIEDLSLDRSAEDAEELLTAWSAPLHPTIVAIAERTPRWLSAEENPPPDDLEDALVFLPKSSEQLLPDDWVEKATQAGALVLRDLRDRDRVVATALAALDDSPAPIDTDMANDFFALGFCQFLVELLTRQLRYMSSLDEDQFQTHVVEAAEALARGDTETTKEQLQNAFDQLTQAREYFYPTEASFIDLTLVAPATMGAALRAELKRSEATNLLLLGSDLEEMADGEPETFEQIRQALGESTLSIAGGEHGSPPLALMPIEAILGSFRRGLAAYERLLGQPAKVFGRRRFGLSPLFPQIIEKLGFAGALHITMDAGRFPSGNQSRVHWEGAGGASIEALAREPLDASRPDAFLALPEKLGDALDLDHDSTLVFAHWPGHGCRWYEDLRRMANYAPVLGRFDDLDHYFEESYGSGHPGNYAADQYRSPYLPQAVAGKQVDPISRWARYYRRRTVAEALAGLRILARMISSEQAKIPADDLDTLFQEIDDSLETAGDVDKGEVDKGDDLDRRITDLTDQAASSLADAIPRKADVEPRSGRLLLNPWSFSRTQRNQETPAMGFAWIDKSVESNSDSSQRQTAGSRTKSQKRSLFKRNKKTPQPPLAEENKLRNEHFEITFDTATGAIRAIHDYRARGNRLAQQLALRLPGINSGVQVSADDDEAPYSIMAVDELSAACCDEEVGEMLARGRLVDREAKTLATFAQTTRVRRGSRVIELDIEIDPQRLPGANPWDSYYAARFAWNDATADVFRDVNSTSHPTEAARLESPRFVDIRSHKARATILSGGLPYHRRFGLRKLDTLLIVKGETARRFRLGIGIDLPQAVAAAADFLAPDIVFEQTAAPPMNPTGWLFHIDSRNVTATDWQPLEEDGRLVGFATRLLETEGRNTHCHLRCFRPMGQAETTDFRGEDRNDLTVENDRISIDLAAHEWLQVEARWEARPASDDDGVDPNDDYYEEPYFD